VTAQPVRPARLEDASAIARIHVLSWQSAYRGLLPEAFLHQLDIARRTEQWQDWLQAMPHKQEEAWVIEASGQPVGFACCGLIRGSFEPFDSEIYAIYLLPEKQGQGLGRVLFSACRQALDQRGLRRHLVWVLRDNQPARHFYAAQGGSPCFERRQRLGTELEVDEVGYGWLAPEA
jgi:GNAT superfamily N-acetyltransferase